MKYNNLFYIDDMEKIWRKRKQDFVLKRENYIQKYFKVNSEEEDTDAMMTNVQRNIKKRETTTDSAEHTHTHHISSFIVIT